MPKKLDTEIKDLTIPSDKTFLKSYIYEPKTHKEKKYGKVLAVFEIGTEQNKAQELFETITSLLRKEYYKEQKNIGANFEIALNKINEALANLAQKGEVDWIGKLNVSLVGIKERSIILSCSGRAKIILLRGKDLIDISEGVASKSPSPVKIFTNIVSGDIQPQDKLILCSLPLFEVIPQEKLKKVQEISCDMAYSYLREELSNINSAALIVEIKKAEIPREAEGLKKVKPTLGIRYPSLEIEEKGDEEKAPLEPQRQKEKLTELAGTTGKFIRGGIAGASQVFRKVSGVIEKGKPSGGITKSQTVFCIKWEEFKKFFKDIPRNFRRLPKTSRIFFVAALMLLVLFCGSIAALSCKRKEGAKLVQYEDLLSSARDKEKAAQDALIYKDEEKAKTLLVEAKSLVDEILNEERVSKKQRQEAESLLSTIQTNIDKTEHIIKIAEPQVLANFEEMEPALDLQRLVGIKDKVYSFNPDTNAILGLDEENRQLVTLPVPSFDIGHLLLAASIKDKDKIVFYTDTSHVAELDIEENKLEKIEIEFAHHDQNIKDIAIYLDKVYLLDIAHNQIYKHSRTISGYSRGQAWLNKEINLENAQSLAIDGHIWVLTSDGTILKFLTGELQEFTLEQLTTPLDCPTKIIISLDLENLYIVDSKNKRIVAFDKEGELINQYVSDSFNDLKDIYINEKEDKMYLLCGKKIYGIGLE